MEKISVFLNTAEETARQAFDRQSKMIDKLLDDIQKDWKKTKTKKSNELKANPKSWSGVGRGSELATAIEYLENVEKFFK